MLSGPFEEPGFRRLYLARLFSYLGDGIAPVALAFGVLSVDPSPTALGSVLALRYMSLGLFLLVAGVIGDRLPRKRILIASDVVRFFTQAATAWLLLTGNAEVWMLAALASIYGVGEAFFRPISTSFIPEIVPQERLQQANALLASTSSLAIVIGPPIAGIAIATTSAGWAIALDALTFLVSALFVAMIRPLQALSRSPRSPWLDLIEGWKHFRSRTWLWVDGLHAALGNAIVVAPFLALGPVVAIRSLEGPLAWSIILGAFGLGSVVGGTLLLRVRPKRPLLFGLPMLALLALPTGLLALSAPTLVVAAGALAGGVGFATYSILFETTVQHLVPPEYLARVVSICWTIAIALTPVGYALVGPVADAFGLTVPLMLAAGWVLVSSLVVVALPSVRSIELPR